MSGTNPVGVGFPGTAPALDTATGIFTPVWFQFFATLWRRSGGASGQTAVVGGSASGTTSDTATKLNTEASIITSGTGGVRILNDLTLGAISAIYNFTPGTITVYPPIANSQINGHTAGVSVSLPTNTVLNTQVVQVGAEIIVAASYSTLI